MGRLTCLLKTFSLTLTVLLLLLGFVAIYYEQHILLHITALFLAVSAVLPIYDNHRVCRKSRNA
ncbi:MAG: hypothetical protein GY807_24420 [Gammaproteobacteria bacterium]|nr:hypothetical protein [Gammaproteobacteria bacterium]